MTDPLAPLLDERDRFRDALAVIQRASALLSHEQDNPLNVLLGDTGDLSWSAIHTFVTDVVDLGMSADAALADLTDEPPGALDAIARRPSSPQEFRPHPTWVPEQPHRE